MTDAQSLGVPPADMHRLRSASDLLREGRHEEAFPILRALVRDAPDLAHAHRLLGVALSETGDLMSAEAAFRAALAVDPSIVQAKIDLAETLRMLDRGNEAVDLLAPLVTKQTTNLSLLTYFGFALQSVGRWDEALVCFQQAAKATPSSGVAEHNAAGALADLSRFAESEAAVRRAFAKGVDAPETWLVLAHALDGQDRWAEADAAYAEALSRRPGFSSVVGDLANRVWMLTGDQSQGEALIDEAITLNRYDPDLLIKKAKIKEYAGDLEGAAEVLDRAAELSDDALIHVAIAQLAVWTDPSKALFHAQRAFALRPDNYAVIAALCQTRLAKGRSREALELATILAERQPWDQYALALMATCWRMQDDSRYQELFHYQDFVRSFELGPPPEWTSLSTWLCDLEAELRPLHRFNGHPVGQSLRGGSQTMVDLKHAQTPAITAFLRILDEPIRAYTAGIGAGPDPLRRRNSSRYRLDGVWSVRLRPGGFHTDHVHQRGWVSSAFYVAVPPVTAHGREGWLKFGEPGTPTQPRLQPEHFEQPTAGKLVLFPSYMWHGTIPFSGDQSRLSIAFDIIPEKY